MSGDYMEDESGQVLPMIPNYQPCDLAFPSKDDKYFHYGMTFREYASTKIMAGLAAGLAMSSSWGSHTSNARDAVAAADALIAELNKPALPPVKEGTP